MSNHNYKKQKDYREAQARKKIGVEKEMEIKIIRLGETENPFEHFDSPVVPLTEEQTEAINESVKKSFKEMSDFIGIGEK